MSTLYRRAARRCRSVNQFNALHIELENRMTPLELMALRGELGRWLRLRVRLRRVLQRLLPLRQAAGVDDMAHVLREEWLEKLSHRLYARTPKPQPEPYRRRKLSRHLRLYSAGGARQDKTLLICFVGASNRPFLPTPVFLQHLDAARTDMLLVGYPRGNGVRRGLPELGCSFEETVDKLRGVAAIDSYRRCVTLGISGGGTPALLAALRLGLSAALSAGGGSPTDPRWFAALGEHAGDLARRYVAASASLPQVTLAFGADAERDAAAARAFAQCLPAELRPVHDDHRTVQHNIFSVLLRRGRLQSFLESTVLEAPR